MESNEPQKPRKPRVLIAAEWFPPAFRAGGPIRSVAHLAAFLAETHEVRVVTGGYDLGQPAPLPGVVLDVWQKVFLAEHGQAVEVMYLSKGAANRERWSTLFQDWRPDFLHLNSLYSWGFALLPLQVAHRHPKTRVVVAPRGMLGAAALAIKPLKKRFFWKAMKLRGWFDDVLWHVSSSHEAEEVKAMFFGRMLDIEVAQNLPAPPPPPGPPRETDRWILAVVGRVHPVKRVLEVLESLRVLSAEGELPRWELHIIGPEEDAGYAARCGNLAERLPHPVVFHGGLSPEQVGEWLDRSHFLLSPTQQENFGHAIVEAWSRGCGVVLSDRTPWRGLMEAGIGWEGAVETGEWRAGLAQMLTMEMGQWIQLSDRARDFYRLRVLDPGVLDANRRIFEA
jgi:glycosyltransferase involved in cell wall biosynthesis